MAYVIAEPCIGVKDNSCIEVCPVDCIHPTPEEPDYEQVDQLYIDPEECIDCDACVEACPVDAITSEDQVPEEWQRFTKRNADFYRKHNRMRPAPRLDDVKALTRTNYRFEVSSGDALDHGRRPAAPPALR